MKKIVVVVTLLVIYLVLTSAVALAKFGQISNSMKDRILSQDVQIAQEALEQNQKHKNVEAICLSLKHPSLFIRGQAADALRKIPRRISVKCLLEALKNNQGIYLGGTEVKIEQDKVNENIVRALKTITGLNLLVKASFTAAEIKQITSRIERWLEANHQGIG